MRSAALQTWRSVKEDKNVLQALEQRLPCRLWCRPLWGSCAPAAHEGLWWAEINLQHMVKIMVRKDVPLQPMEVQVEQQSTWRPWRSSWQSRYIPKRGCEKPTLEQDTGMDTPCGSMETGVCTASVLLSELVTSWGSHAGVGCACRTAPCGRASHWSSLWRTAASGRTHIGEVCGELSPMGDTMPNPHNAHSPFPCTSSCGRDS